MVTEYLVNYGRAGFLGRFVNRVDKQLAHGAVVVVQNARGDEIGTVKVESVRAFAPLVGATVAGDILRELSDADREHAAELVQRAESELPNWQQAIESLGFPLTVLDGELLLGGDTAILQILPFADFDGAALTADLHRQFGLNFFLHDVRHDLSEVTEESKGCGKPGCGSTEGGGGCSSCGTGGGCSTGSCSKGSVKSADDLTAYFADLRQQMERLGDRVPLLG